MKYCQNAVACRRDFERRRDNKILYFKTIFTNRINSHYKGTYHIIYYIITLQLKIIMLEYVGRLRD